MNSRGFLLTFDWVLNHLVMFNHSESKSKLMLNKLKYIAKLAATRGSKISMVFLSNLCQLKMTKVEIRKGLKKLIQFVSAEEIKTLLQEPAMA
ncbi:MAG: hypothetical protein ACO2ZM_09390 [Francisellaceae bacterium]